MKIEVKIKDTGPKPVQIESIRPGLAFQLTPGPNQPIYIMDAYDDSHYYAINTGQMRVATLNGRIMVYPVTIKNLKVEIELE
jgi:hypothetical protein